MRRLAAAALALPAATTAQAAPTCIARDADWAVTVAGPRLLRYAPTVARAHDLTLARGCPAIARDAIPAIEPGVPAQLCVGDFVRFIDRTSGIPGARCRIGAIEPAR